MRSASRSPPRVAVAEEVAFRLCNDVVNCLADRSFAKLHACALRALKLTATVSILETTGIGVLINDKSIWELSPDRETSSLAAKTAMKWRQLYRGAQLPVNECLSLPGERVARPLGGFSGRAFLSKVVDVMAEFEKEEPTAASRTLKQAAVTLVLRGFNSVRELDGLAGSEVAGWFPSPAVAAMASRVAARMTLKMARTRALELLEIRARENPAGVSSLCVAEEVDPAKRPVAARELVVDLDQEGLAGVGESLRPREALVALEAAAADDNAKVLHLLDRKAQMTLASTKLRSMGGAASALKAWHAFATLMLRYDEGATLPPRMDSDVLRWLTTFRNPGTAANYLGAIRWAVVAKGLCKVWDSDRVAMYLKGARKEALARVGSTLQIRVLMSENLVWQAAKLALRMPGAEFVSPLALVSWEFLFRVQSEALALQLGNEGELLSLPEGRHSAVVFATDPKSNLLKLVIRLRRRKHRQAGSLLKRSCSCGKTNDPETCAVHSMLAWVSAQGVRQGEHILRMRDGSQPTAGKALSALKRVLGVLGVPNAAAVSFKAFRAGKATSMASSGYTLAQILNAGEWRSSAYIKYVDETLADEQEVLRQAVENSSDEEN